MPIDDDRVRAAFLGIEPHHERRHLVRAAIESVAFQYPYFLDIIERAGHDVRSITIADGEARSPLWNQIKADVLGRPLLASSVAEAPAIGAAILAGLAAGAFATPADAIAALTPPRTEYHPDPARHAAYRAVRERWEAGRHHVLAAARP